MKLKYSLPDGPIYTNDEGDLVLIIALPSDTVSEKVIGLCEGKPYLFEPADLRVYTSKKKKARK